MAEGKDSFVFYKSFYDAIKQIPEEYQLELYNAISQYSLEGIEPINLSNIASAMFTLIKPNIDSSQKKYEASVNNGKKGGRPKKENQEKPNNNLDKTQEEPKRNLNDNDNVNDNNIYSPLDNGQDNSLLEDFEKIWSIYPRKEGKAKAFKTYQTWLKGKKVCGKNMKLTNRQIWYATKKYAEESKEKEKTFIKMGSTFFTDAILDYVEVENEQVSGN